MFPPDKFQVLNLGHTQIPPLWVSPHFLRILLGWTVFQMFLVCGDAGIVRDWQGVCTKVPQVGFSRHFPHQTGYQFCEEDHRGDLPFSLNHINMAYYCWSWPWSPAWVTVGQASLGLSPFHPLFMLYLWEQVIMQSHVLLSNFSEKHSVSPAIAVVIKVIP